MLIKDTRPPLTSRTCIRVVDCIPLLPFIKLICSRDHREHPSRLILSAVHFFLIINVLYTALAISQILSRNQSAVDQSQEHQVVATDSDN